MIMKNGIVIGKFYPLHKGHQYLIETAYNNCDNLHIILCSLDNETPNGDIRFNFLKKFVENKKINIYHIKNYETKYNNDSLYWVNKTIEIIKIKPDIIFCSENYGKTYSEIMNCENYIVDFSRNKFNISGTMIRNNPYKYWDYIDSYVKEYYTKRIVFIGPESTGKTTICKKLAKQYNTLWVPEYGREYSSKKLLDKDNIIYEEYNDNDFHIIATKQNEIENEYSGKCNKILFCDTNSFATYIWCWRYLKKFNKDILKIYEMHKKPDMLFLMEPDIQFIQDGTRDGEDIRYEMFNIFKQELENNKINYRIINGTYKERIDKVNHFLSYI